MAFLFERELRKAEEKELLPGSFLLAIHCRPGFQSAAPKSCRQSR